MTESYQYRQTYRGPKSVPPEIVAVELQALGTTGDVTARRVVEAAKPKTAALHNEFEWDDKVCGVQFRLEQARRLIRAIMVAEEPTKDEPNEPTSVYVHVPETKGQGKYVPLAVVADNIDEYERALTEAQRYLGAAENRFNELRRLAERRGGKTEALAIAVQGFATVRQAIELLR